MEKGAFLSLVLRSLRDFQDKDLAEIIISLMCKQQKFFPDVYDYYEPLKKTFDINCMPDMVEVWMNSDKNNQNFEKDYATGHFIAKRKRKCKTNYFVSWTKNQMPTFNLFTFNLEVDELTGHNNFFDFMQLSDEFIKAINPVHGDIGIFLPNENNPVNLRIRCPELKWMTIFGAPYIDLFGREKLLSAPCHKVHLISDSLIGLQLVESIYDEIPSGLRRTVKSHLGEEAFVEEGKGIKRHKTGLTPEFDYSGVLFDPKKPIVVPQILTRKR